MLVLVIGLIDPPVWSCCAASRLDSFDLHCQLTNFTPVGLEIDELLSDAHVIVVKSRVKQTKVTKFKWFSSWGSEKNLDFPGPNTCENVAPWMRRQAVRCLYV